MRAPASTAIKLHAAVCVGVALLGLRRDAAGRGPHSVPQAVHSGASHTGAGGDHLADADEGAGLVALAYELLDAHADTAQLVADGLAYDLSWVAHLDYLRALQRKGREILARTAPEELSPCRSADSESLDVR